MNKRILSLMAAGIVTVSIAIPAKVNAAPQVSMGDTQIETSSREHNSGIFDTNSPDASNPNGNGDQNTAGPKITVKKDKFLVLKGAEFDFASELGLKIVDETDGDITGQLKIPAIDTSKADTLKKTVKAVNSKGDDFASELGLKIVDETDGDITGQLKIPAIDTSKADTLKKTVKAVNSKGEVSTLDLIINVVGVKDSLSLANPSELDTFDLGKLIEGDPSGLTLAVKKVAEDGSAFTLTITDGTNAVEKEVKLNSNGETPNEEGTDKPVTDGEQSEENKQEGTDTPSENNEGTPNPAPGTNTQTPPANNGGSGNATLPQTGAVATGIGSVGLLTAGAAFLRHRSRK